jgi:uroporphyrin-III C-methyltransferase
MAERGPTARREGRVLLVGAGPGDADLLTIKAVRAIRAATVLLVDDLVGEGCLRHARRGTRIVHVGKRAGCKSTPQAFIEQLMIREARRGETVVRLKGGDPLVFGRAGEELAALRAAGVAVEVVNGVTAALAAAESLGVSLTHRDHAHGVIFVTGHAKGEDAQLDWAQLAATAAQGFTLVIYMGVAQAAVLQQAMLRALPAHTPAAVVQAASTAHERRALCTLATLPATIARERLESPAVLIVGDVLQGAAALAQRPAAARFGS